MAHFQPGLQTGRDIYPLRNTSVGTFSPCLSHGFNTACQRCSIHSDNIPSVTHTTMCDSTPFSQERNHGEPKICQVWYHPLLRRERKSLQPENPSGMIVGVKLLHWNGGW